MEKKILIFSHCMCMTQSGILLLYRPFSHQALCCESGTSYFSLLSSISWAETQHPWRRGGCCGGGKQPRDLWTGLSGLLHSESTKQRGWHPEDTLSLQTHRLWHGLLINLPDRCAVGVVVGMFTHDWLSLTPVALTFIWRQYPGAWQVDSGCYTAQSAAGTKTGNDNYWVISHSAWPWFFTATSTLCSVDALNVICCCSTPDKEPSCLSFDYTRCFNNTVYICNHVPKHGLY